jgi:CBS domain-containing membrane protein
MTVRDIMTTKLFTIRADQRLFVAGEIMEWAHTRHVPVVDPQGRLTGLVSHRDLLGASISSHASNIAAAERRQHLTQIAVGDVMHTPTRTTHPEVTVQEAAATLRTFHIGCLPVIEGGRLVGIVTAHDLLGVVAHLPPGQDTQRAHSAAQVCVPSR